MSHDKHAKDGFARKGDSESYGKREIGDILGFIMENREIRLPDDYAYAISFE